MIQVALKLGSLSEADTVLLASTIINGLHGASAVTPNPTVAALTVLHDDAQDALDAVVAAQQALAAVVNKDNAMDALRAGLSHEADTVLAAVASMPDAQAESTVVAAGMRVRSASTHVTSLDAVTHLSATAGDTPGEIDWHCEPVTATWTPGRSTTASSGSLTGLTSGSSVSIRMHAEGARGLSGTHRHRRPDGRAVR